MKTFTKSLLALAVSAGVALPAFASPQINVTLLSTYAETACPVSADGEECAEISAYDSTTNRVFITNAKGNALRILQINSDNIFEEFANIDLSIYGGGPNSVAISNGLVAVAIEANNKQNLGSVEIFDTDGNHLRTIVAGALPDMVTFTPDGQFILVANEGEPNDAYTNDPEGSITVINTSSWLAQTANFHAFADKKLKDVRIFGPGASVPQDLEPEFITVSEDSTTAWISLQENNAIAKLDIASATITDITGLGFKHHTQAKNAFDASDKDGGINLQRWPTLGMYMPDAIASYQRGNATFLLTANEGDSRDYEGYSEETRVEDLILDAKRYPDAETLQEKSNLGRLKTTTANGDIDGDGDVDQIYSFGGRSFSVWNANGQLVFDSGSQFEEFLAQYQNNGTDVWVENRSDDKGPEPESITVGQLAGEDYVFIGLERASGIFIYKLSSPYRPQPAGYIDLKPFGDQGPEGLKFIAKDDNTGWLLISNEVSSTTSLYEIKLN